METAGKVQDLVCEFRSVLRARKISCGPSVFPEMDQLHLGRSYIVDSRLSIVGNAIMVWVSIPTLNPKP